MISNVERKKIMGVRIPKIRKYAKEIKDTDTAQKFLAELPHEYYDENCLHSILISEEKDFCKTVRLLDEFLPYVNNWATCDIISPKSFKNCNKAELLEKIYLWMRDEYPYTVRFGIGMLLKFYLDGDFDLSQAQRVAAVKSGEYYVNMMKAWYFATALAKQYDSAVKFLEEGKLDSETLLMTVKKANESFRISKDRKEYINTFKKQKSGVH